MQKLLALCLLLTQLTGPIIIERPGLFPEGLAWDADGARFFVGSATDGTIYALADDGTLAPFATPPNTMFTAGLHIDGDRLYAMHNDLSRGAATLAIYALATAERTAFIALNRLVNAPRHFLDDITTDPAGNVYITDTAAGVIYRVSPEGVASVWLQRADFAFALNGITVQPGGFLLAVRSDGLIRVPLDNPSAFTAVELSEPLPGADGLALMPDGTLIVASNAGTAYALRSDDDFATACIAATENAPAAAFPTSVTVRDGVPFVVHSYLGTRTVNPRHSTFGVVPFIMDPTNVSCR